MLSAMDQTCPANDPTTQRLETDSNFDSHSIFSDVRKHELSVKLPRSRKITLVLAWGLSEKLDPLIQRCLSRIPGSRMAKGLLAEGSVDKYRHPLPSFQKDKQAWLDRMIRHCEE